jgi:hypothetical protein
MAGGTVNLGKLHGVEPVPIRWPNPVGTPIQQIRQITAAAQPNQVQNGLGSSNVQSINQPQPISIIRVGTKITSTTTKQLTVSFLQNPADPNYQKANVHIKIGKALPVVVASGSTSPITVSVPRTTVPATVLVQAEGNWGPHPLQNSPSKTVNLS